MQYGVSPDLRNSITTAGRLGASVTAAHPTKKALEPTRGIAVSDTTYPNSKARFRRQNEKDKWT